MPATRWRGNAASCLGSGSRRHTRLTRPAGKETLADLFDGRSQLIVHHFMLGPGWTAGCPGCSFTADHIEGALVHLEHHDVERRDRLTGTARPRSRRTSGAWAGA